MPVYSVIGVLIAGAGVFVAMHWWAEGALEASEAIILAFVFAGIVIGLFSARNIVQFFVALIPLAAAGGYAIFYWKMGSWRAYYKSRCRDLEAAILADPQNLAAREFLADALYALGDLDRANDEIQAAVDLGAGMECQHKLGKWSKERYLRDTTNPVCRWCGTENQPSTRICSRCGADLPYDNPFTRWLVGGRWARARYYLIFISAIAVVVTSWLLLGFIFSVVALLFCLLAVVGWSLISSARSR